MREHGLNARVRRKFIPATDSNHGLPVCENILSREFQAERDRRNGGRTSRIRAPEEAGYI
jgi:transposase InsO family protein